MSREANKTQELHRQTQLSATRAKAASTTQRLAEFELTAGALAASTSGAAELFLSAPPPASLCEAGSGTGPAADTAYIEQVRARKAEEEEARKEREKRRRRLIVRNMQAQKSAHQRQRQEQLAAKLQRQSQQERRIATQLQQLRGEKEIIRQNRMYVGVAR